MPLPRRTTARGAFEPVNVNVYDIQTKQIVFNGGQKLAAQFMGVPHAYMGYYLKSKAIVKKKYTVRLAKNPT